MKLVFSVIVGVFVSFGFTMLGELIVMRSITVGVHLPFAEMTVGGPLIALTAGSLIGLIAKDRARIAAVLGLAPWVAFLLIGTGRGHSAVSWWAILIAAVSIYLLLGIGAAILVGRRMTRTAALKPRSVG